MKRILLIFSCIFFLCKVSYAQECLKPISQSQQELWGAQYFEQWYSKEAKQQFLVFPSFFQTREALYVYSWGKNPGTLVVKTKPLRKKDAVVDTSKDSISMYVGKDVTMRLGSLLRHAVNTSNYLYDRIGLDGCRYFFFDGRNGATCWSPDGACGRMVELLKDIMQGVREGNLEKIVSCGPRIDSLATHFKGHYPEVFFNITSDRDAIRSQNGVEEFIYLSSGMNNLNFKFKHSAIQGRSPGEIKEQYGEMVSSLLHHIFFNTTLLDDYSEILIVVDNENTHAHVSDRTIYRLELIVHQDDLTLERLISLLTTN